VVQVDDNGRVVDFVEKPKTDEAIEAVSTDLDWIQARGVDPKGRDCIASMGIYVFNRDLLFEMLSGSSYTDFGKEVFPATINSHHVNMHLRARFLPPTRMEEAKVKDSLIANGCVIGKGAVIENSVIGLRTIIQPNVVIKNSIVMGCDFYDARETPRNIAMEIGEGTVIENSIIDKNVSIGKNVRIVNSSNRDQTDLAHPVCVF